MRIRVCERSRSSNLITAITSLEEERAGAPNLRRNPALQK